ncbi:MAG TPA: hypothetical protein VGE14_16065 [Marmoricola sp.]
MRPAPRAAVWWALACLPLLVGGGPAAAADVPGVVAVSVDGVHWTSSLSEPIFDPDVRWVPGDRRTSSFFVRNSGPTPATVRVQVLAEDDDLVRAGDLRFAARVDGGTWAQLPPDGAAALVRVAPLPQGRRSVVDIRIAFDPASTNSSQRADLELWFVVRLTEAQPGYLPGEAPGEQPGQQPGQVPGEVPGNAPGVDDDDGVGVGWLPATGAPAVTVTVVVAASLLGVGLGLTRRRQEARHG